MNSAAEGLRFQANAAFARQDYAAAEELYTTALLAAEQNNFTKDVDLIYNNRAAARLKLHNVAGALQDAQAALLINPRNVKAFFRSALVLNGLQRFEEARQMLVQALALEPHNPEVKRLLDQVSQACAQQAVHAAGTPASSSPGKLVDLHVVDSGSPAAATTLIQGGRVNPEVLPAELRAGHIFVPAPGGVTQNVLILLHGLGDKPAPYADLARKMQLPQTACLALAGPLQVPETDGGRAWFHAFDDDWELISPRAGDNRRTRSLERCRQLMAQLISNLVASGRFQHKQLHLFGFSQGGTAALEVHRHFTGANKLGGCVSVSGCLLEELMWQAEAQPPAAAAASGAATAAPATAGGSSPSSAGSSPSSTGSCGPVIITVGSLDEPSRMHYICRTVSTLQRAGCNATVHTVAGKGHAMIGSAEEMRALMTFWSQTLSIRPVGPGIVEVKASS